MTNFQRVEKMSEKGHDVKPKVTKGYFRSGLPYVRIGNRPHILVIFEGLSFENKAPSGFTLRMIASSYKRFAKDYTCLLYTSDAADE